MKCWSGWSRRMQAASEALDFEAAALYRDQIRALRGVRQTQFVSQRALRATWTSSRW